MRGRSGPCDGCSPGGPRDVAARVLPPESAGRYWRLGHLVVLARGACPASAAVQVPMRLALVALVCGMGACIGAPATEEFQRREVCMMVAEASCQARQRCPGVGVPRCEDEFGCRDLPTGIVEFPAGDLDRCFRTLDFASCSTLSPTFLVEECWAPDFRGI